MSKLIKWPSIEQFRNVIRNVKHKTMFVSVDPTTQEPIYDRNRLQPTLKFRGTVKLHGTNAAVCERTHTGELWAQSRENVLSETADNAGFYQFMKANEHSLRTIIAHAKVVFGVHAAWNKPYISIFGEWCGGNIQKGVAITGLPKMFVLFGIAFADEEGNKTYLTEKQVEDVVSQCRDFVGNDCIIKNIWDFKTFALDINFEDPHVAQNLLGEMTEAVEKSCPVGEALGSVGVGEGIVWRCIEEGWEDSAYWFKVKGLVHQKQSAFTNLSVNPEIENQIKQFLKENNASDFNFKFVE